MAADLKVPITIYFPYELAQKLTDDSKFKTGGDRSRFIVDCVLDGYEYRRGLPKSHPMTK